jgi:hypothetical protein
MMLDAYIAWKRRSKSPVGADSVTEDDLCAIRSMLPIAKPDRLSLVWMKTELIGARKRGGVKKKRLRKDGKTFWGPDWLKGG